MNEELVGFLEGVLVAHVDPEKSADNAALLVSIYFPDVGNVQLTAAMHEAARRLEKGADIMEQASTS